MNKNKLILLLLIFGIIIFIGITVKFAGQSQDIRNRAAGTTVELVLSPNSETFNIGQTKTFDLQARFSNPSDGEKLDYFRTELTFNKNFLRVGDNSTVKYINTSTSQLGRVIEVSTAENANSNGKIVIELGVADKNLGPNTKNSNGNTITIAKLYFTGFAATTADEKIIISTSEIVNNSQGILESKGSEATFRVTNTVSTPTVTSPPSETTNTPIPTNAQSCINIPSSDEFNTGSINTGYWFVKKDDGNIGQANIENSSLKLTAGNQSNTTFAGVLTKKWVCGDFDTKVDFSNFTSGNASEADARLSIERADTNTPDYSGTTIFIETYNKGTEHGIQAISVDNGNYANQEKTSRSSDSGKLRIKRLGSQYTTYYYDQDSSSWKVLKSFNGYAGNVYVSLTAKSWEQNPTVGVNFDNFYIGPISDITPSIPWPTVTSVPTSVNVSPTVRPTPPFDKSQYLIDIGEKGSLTIDIGKATGDTLQLKFKTKLAHLKGFPDLYAKLRVKDELAFLDSQQEEDTTYDPSDACNTPSMGIKDYYIPIKADGEVYSPSNKTNLNPPRSLPANAYLASVSDDGWVSLPALSFDRYYSLFLKTKKTRATRVVEHVIWNSGYNQKEFDWANDELSLQPGDLPDPNNSYRQNCTVNSIDLSLIESRIGNTDADSLRVADVNYDGFINANDISKVVNTLSTKPDDDH